ncbi:transposase [bacterium]|nr:transposase [bacterium]
MDGGYANLEEITKASEAPHPCRVYAPVRKGDHADKQAGAYTPKQSDSAAVAEWRVRMSTAEAQAIYREGAAVAEWANALARNRGLQRFWVRGLKKVRAVLLLFALAHNLMRVVALRTTAAARAA